MTSFWVRFVMQTLALGKNIKRKPPLRGYRPKTGARVSRSPLQRERHKKPTEPGPSRKKGPRAYCDKLLRPRPILTAGQTDWIGAVKFRPDALQSLQLGEVV